MYIIGISAYYHDSAACIIKDGEIIAACQEERFTRKKHDSSFPYNSIKYCIKESNISYKEIDFVTFYEKPFLKFERLLETYLYFAPKGFRSFSNAIPVWIKEKLFQKSNICNELDLTFGTKKYWSNKLLFSEHHLSHASSAFFASPFKEAAILTMDAVGEWATSSISIGKNNNIKMEKVINFPHSLGMIYSAFTYYAGFKVNSGEYKLMGLAPYGKPKYEDLIKNYLIDIKNDGSFSLDMSFFDYCTGTTMTSKKFNRLFGGPPRIPESEITQKEMDIASSIQKVTEEVLLKIAKNIKEQYKQDNLCLAGGVALNCVANGKLLKSNLFKNIWIQPAAGDAGGCIGAALATYYLMLKNDRSYIDGNDIMKGSYLGPSYTKNEIESSLKKLCANYKKYDDNKIIEITAKAISSGKAVGWMSGRMEFGPRALGARSILADPRSPKTQKNLNLKIKYRESFRPFAPSILLDDIDEWFELGQESPYMLLVSEIKNSKKIFDSKKSTFKSTNFLEKINAERSSVPAITHIDYSARIQTVNSIDNYKYHKLISEFKKITGCPILVNTSFNVRGEPIVCSPEDAYRCFMGTELDLLVIDNFIMIKEEQNIKNKENYLYKYELD